MRIVSRILITTDVRLIGLNCLGSVEQSVVFYLNPQPRLDPRKNQNGTLAEDALLMEKFISAESVR